MTIFSPHSALIFGQFPDISLTDVTFHDIPRFTRQVVSLIMVILIILSCNMTTVNFFDIRLVSET